MPPEPLETESNHSEKASNPSTFPAKSITSFLYQKAFHSFRPPFFKRPSVERATAVSERPAKESVVEKNVERSVDFLTSQAPHTPRKPKAAHQPLPEHILERLHLTKNFWIRLGHADNPSIKQRLTVLKKEIKGELKTELKTELKDEVTEEVHERLRQEFFQNESVRTLEPIQVQEPAAKPSVKTSPVPPIDEPPLKTVESKHAMESIDPVRDVHFTRSRQFGADSLLSQTPPNTRSSLYPQGNRYNEWANLYVAPPAPGNYSRLAPSNWEQHPAPQASVPSQAPSASADHRFDDAQVEEALQTGRPVEEQDTPGYFVMMLRVLNVMLILIGCVGIVWGTISWIRGDNIQSALGLPIALTGLAMILVGIVGRMWQDFSDRRRNAAFSEAASPV